jgi:ribosome-interacting GTPase 1
MQVPYQGKTIEAEEVEVLSADEKWNTYKLSNGIWLSIKTVLVRVFAATTEKSPNGEPLYMTNTQTIVKVK